eukprot:6487403-Amphidinium_carterae.3
MQCVRPLSFCQTSWWTSGPHCAYRPCARCSPRIRLTSLVTILPFCVDVRVTASPPLEQLTRRDYGHDAPAAAQGLQPLFHGFVLAVFDVAGPCSPPSAAFKLEQLLSWMVQKHAAFMRYRDLSCS